MGSQVNQSEKIGPNEWLKCVGIGQAREKLKGQWYL